MKTLGALDTALAQAIAQAIAALTLQDILGWFGPAAYPTYRYP